ncbi:MobQ family relaxase [Evansella halocellulosilytica]|uniref:MobQ family relaxase n=1 Tax=Evansella halocellulosilytica TaxID=2011013 RepID=UPI0015C97312|nr:MobQ family relaxase [Evansella halocellulosilytica]
MAVGYYHLSVNTISRGKGQSAVAASSYRSGEALYSNDDQEMKFYGQRDVQPETYIIAPEHAPDWVYDREKLWNEVEHKEASINSRLAREVRVALPTELPLEEQTKLVKSFVVENFTDKGMVADIAIHRDVEHNSHAHIMLTVRPFEEDGSWGQKQRKIYLYDEEGNKLKTEKGNVKSKTEFLTNWDKKETLEIWRENWAEKANEAFKEIGSDVRVSHKSYEETDINKIARHRLTWEEYKAEKEAQIQAQIQGKEYEPVTHMGEVNKEIEETNELLSEIDERVVSLEEYKKSLEKEIDKQFIPNVREEFPLSEEQVDALKYVSNRVHGYVTYENAKENLEKVENWGISIEKEARKLDVEGHILGRVRDKYKDDPKSVLYYGFLPRSFEQEHKIRQIDYTNRANNFTQKMSSFDEALIKSLIAYEVQKEIIHREFSYIYPQYSHITEGFNESIIDLKHAYVQEYLRSGIKYEYIEEFEEPQLMKDYSVEKVSDQTLLKEWRENQSSLLIANRAVSKANSEFTVIWKEYKDTESVYNVHVKLETAKEQVKDREFQKEKLNERMTRSLADKYTNQPKEIIEAIPAKMQAKLIEWHLDNRSTGKLSKDLKLIEKDLQKDGKSINDLYEMKDIKTSGIAVTQLFSNLVNSSSPNDKGQDLDEIKRKQKSKLLRKDHSKEIELGQ